MADNKKSNTGRDSDIEDQITAAFETLSDEDKELFEDTQLIHTDRDVDVETQVHHVLKLQKKNRRKTRIVILVILILVIIGIAGSFLGIYYVRRNRAEENNRMNVKEKVEIDPVDIDASNFPDSVFRERIITPADKNKDGVLSGDEISSIIMINLAGDQRITDLTGIQYLVNLQSLDINGTSVSSLDLSENRELTNLNVGGTGITTLDLSKQTKLTTLNLNNCTSLTEIILPSPSAVTSVNTENTNITCEMNNEGIYTGCKVNQQG